MVSASAIATSSSSFLTSIAKSVDISVCNGVVVCACVYVCGFLAVTIFALNWVFRGERKDHLNRRKKTFAASPRNIKNDSEGQRRTEKFRMVSISCVVGVLSLTPEC